MTDTERERITAICEVAGVAEIDDLSDGFHTFRQLYYQRMMLFATIVKQNKDKAWKSLRHEDGELCFGGGWFIVGIDTPEGSYTYHYENKYFDLFDCEILDYGKHWDGHTEKDVTRLLSLPKAQLFSEGTTSDLISRVETVERLRRVLDATVPITDYDEGYVDGIEFGISTVSTMPTIQPEERTEERTETHACDLISRQQAIDALDKQIKQCCKALGSLSLSDVDKHAVEVEMASLRAYRGMLENLPTVQPEPQEGHWIDKGWDGDWAWQIDGRGNCWRLIECSECGKRVLAESNYCPNCGAKMKGERQK